MYNQFCKNLTKFIKLNQSYPNIRLKLAQEINFLVDVSAYSSLKERNDIKSKEIRNFISQLKNYSGKYPSISKFVWELWAYGFDVEDVEDIDQEPQDIMEEKVKLIDLLLSPQYFI